MESETRVNYLIEAEIAWNLVLPRDSPTEEELQLTQKLFKSLPLLKHVESINIDGSHYSFEEFCLFTDCLRENESITSATIRCWCQGDDQALMDQALNRLLLALSSRTISLKELDLPWGGEYQNSMESLLDVIRSNPDLQKLRISSSFTDDHIPLITNQVRESCEGLISLQLYVECGFQGLCTLADFAGQSRVVQSVKSSTGVELEITEEDVEELKRRIGVENTKLIEFDTWNPRHKVDVTMANKERLKEEERQERLKRVQEFKKRLAESTPGEANYDLTKFPPELMFSLLVYTGLISAASAFFQTCKHWRTIGIKSNFWKHLAEHVMPVFEPEVLQFTEVYYAEHIQKYGANNCNFWEFLVRHHYSYCGFPTARWITIGITDKTTKRLPFPHPPPSSLLHEQFLTALLRRYPGLMERIETCNVSTVAGESRKLYMHLHQGAYMFHYHMTIRSFDNNKIIGYFFISNEEKNPTYVSQSLDYFVAHTVEDALVKMKRMVETFYVLMGRRIEYTDARYSVSSSLLRAKKSFKKLVQEIDTNMGARAQQIIKQFGIGGEQVDVLGQFAHTLNQQMRELPIVIQNYLVERKQKLPSRNTLHTLYPAEVLKTTSFITGDRDSVRGVEYSPIKPLPKKKPRNSSVKGTLMKVMRIMVNFIVMPVLQTMWPRHVNEMDKGPTREQFRLPGGLLERYHRYFKPLSGVTVDNAAPSCWPMTALVIASQITHQVSLVIEQLVGIRLKKVNKEDVDVSMFIESLAVYEKLIPPKHVAEFHGVIKRLVEFS
jgi:hypothetical protein